MADLLADLAARGYGRSLEDGAALERARDALRPLAEDPPPWFVRALVGAGTWVGAALLAVFLGAAGLLDKEAARIFLGAAALALGAKVSRGRPTLLGGQLALTGAVVGSTLLFAGFAESVHRSLPGEAGLGVLTAAVAALTSALVRDGVVRFLGAGTIACAVAFTAYDSAVPGSVEAAAGLAAAGTCAILLLEGTIARRGLRDLARPCAYGLAIAALVLCRVAAEMALHPTRSGPPGAPWALAATNALLAAGVAWTAFGEVGAALGSARGAVALGGIAAASALAPGEPGVACGLLLVALGRLRGETLLGAIGLTGLGATAGWHIFVLEMSRLEKSFALLGIGVALLLARALADRLSAEGAREEGEGGGAAAAGAAGAAARRLGLREAAVLATALLVVAAAGLAAARRERLLAEGTVVRLPLHVSGERAPFLGEGVALYLDGLDGIVPAEAPREGRVVAAVGADGRGRLVRLDGGAPLAAGEVAIRYRRRRDAVRRYAWAGEVRIAGGVFYVAETTADPWRAREVELRVDPATGDAIATALFDEKGEAIARR
jgi:hypothetical protein